LGTIIDDDQAAVSALPSYSATSFPDTKPPLLAQDCQRLAETLQETERKTAAGQLPMARGIELVRDLETRWTRRGCDANRHRQSANR